MRYDLRSSHGGSTSHNPLRNIVQISSLDQAGDFSRVPSFEPQEETNVRSKTVDLIPRVDIQSLPVCRELSG